MLPNQRCGRLPIVVGVTGHRDLRPDDTVALERAVDAIFGRLADAYRTTPLLLLTPLAEGADRLVARVAHRRAIPFRVPMPMPLQTYREDFRTRESLAAFDELLGDASGTPYAMPFYGDNDADNLGDETRRAHQYALLNAHLVRSAHLLIALWGRTHDGRARRYGAGRALSRYRRARALRRKALADRRPGDRARPSRLYAARLDLAADARRRHDGSADPAGTIAGRTARARVGRRRLRADRGGAPRRGGPVRRPVRPHRDVQPRLRERRRRRANGRRRVGDAIAAKRGRARGEPLPTKARRRAAALIRHERDRRDDVRRLLASVPTRTSPGRDLRDRVRGCRRDLRTSAQGALARPRPGLPGLRDRPERSVRVGHGRAR